MGGEFQEVIFLNLIFKLEFYSKWCWTRVVVQARKLMMLNVCVLFWVKFQPDFDLKNMISTYLYYTKDSLWGKKMTQILQILKINKIQIMIIL